MQIRCLREHFFGGKLPHSEGVNFGLKPRQFGGQFLHALFEGLVDFAEALGGDLVLLVELVCLVHFGLDFLDLALVGGKLVSLAAAGCA